MRRTLLSEVCVEGDLRLACHPLFGGDDDHTIGTTCPIDGGGGGILQDVDGLDILRVDVPKTSADHSVDHHQRLRGPGDGILTADIDLEALPRLVAGFGDHHTRDLTLQGLGDVGRVGADDVAGSQGTYGTGQVLLTNGAITHDHHIFHLGTFRDHLYAEGRLVPHSDLLSGIANGINNDHDLTGRRNIQGKFPIIIGDSSACPAFDGDAGTGQRASAFGQHCPAELSRLSPGGERNRHQRDQKEHDFSHVKSF